MCPAARLPKTLQSEIHARVARAQEELDGLMARYDELTAMNAENDRKLQGLGRLLFDEDEEDEEDEEVVVADLAPRPPRGPSPPPPPPSGHAVLV